MKIPSEITFTLQGATKFRGPQEPAPDAPPLPTFGEAFGGQFRLRWPTGLDLTAISAKCVAHYQRLGVERASENDPSWMRTESVMFIEHLKLDVPEWWRGYDYPAFPDMELAVLRAYSLALETMDTEKKFRRDFGRYLERYIAGNLYGLAYRRKYQLPELDPRFTALTDLQIERDLEVGLRIGQAGQPAHELQRCDQCGGESYFERCPVCHEAFDLAVRLKEREEAGERVNWERDYFAEIDKHFRPS